MAETLPRLLVDLEALSVIAGVDPGVTDFNRGTLRGVVMTLELLAEHGLVLDETHADLLWCASMASGGQP
jgi:hypothetical protein